MLIAAIAVPFIGAIGIALAHRAPNVREGVTLVTAGLLAWLVWSLAGPVMGGARPEVAVIDVVPGLTLAFKVEPLGLLFALVASSLWIVNSVYSIGYMRAHEEPRQTPFYVCFAIALGSAVGLAFSRNLFTLFLFYELLTLSTYPLVTHNADKKAIHGGRVYLMLLIGSSMVLLLPAIIVTAVMAGTMEFKLGGILPKGLDAGVVGMLLALYAFGIGKAALMPLHFWLPSAMVAPTPVSALLHAVAVVKAGVFTVLKVVLYVLGPETLIAGGARDWLIYAASATLVLASRVALTRGNLKARLAYSTVSQLAYVVLGGALATSSSLVGAGMHIAMHAAGKITLFFCAGAIYVATHKTEISELDGIGRRMPITMIAFLIGSLTIIGLPPFGGTWSKWLLGVGALDAGFAFVVGVLMVSSLLNVAYLLPIVGRAFFLPPRPGDPEAEGGEAPMACVIPLSITAALCVVLFFAAGEIEALLRPLVAVR
jgi:multicomponent Na+:H+ antiporter subunit D